MNVPLTGLAPGPTYHYRFVTTNPNGTTFGPDATFTTAAPAAGGGGGGGAGPPPAPPSPSAPTSTTTTGLPPPVQSISIDIIPFLGTVLVNGKPLIAGENIPFGATVDARKGTVILESDDNGVIDEMQFAGGIFKLSQAKDGTTVLTLVGGDFSICKATRSLPMKLNGARPPRQQWGNGKGHFETKGRYAAATVRGTIYLVADRCDGTFVKVVRGDVAVQDMVTHKTITVTAGKTYLAKPNRKTKA